MASSQLDEAMSYNRADPGAERPTRGIFRFGQRVTGDDVPSVPDRYRGGPGSPSGRLVGVRLRPATGEAWLRLGSGGPWPRRRRLITVPLGASQAPAPTPDSMELRGGAGVRCHDGSIGRLEGFSLDMRSGLALDLLVHVRGDVLADVQRSTSPLAALLAVGGRRILVAPAWAVSSTLQPHRLPFRGATSALLLDASAEQIASATVVRKDGEVAANIWENWDGNPALAPYTAALDITVRDGDVTLFGSLPSARQRATAEQDVWHVLGVLGVRNRIIVRP